MADAQDLTMFETMWQWSLEENGLQVPNYAVSGQSPFLRVLNNQLVVKFPEGTKSGQIYFDYSPENYNINLLTTSKTGRLILNNNQNTLLNFELQRYLSVATGGVYVINNNLLYKPSLMVKYVPGFPINFDLNSSFLFSKTLWAGFSYRSTQNLVLLLEWNISDQLRGGYSYDLDLSPLRTSRSGSHELFIGFDFLIKKSIFLQSFDIEFLLSKTHF